MIQQNSVGQISTGPWAAKSLGSICFTPRRGSSGHREMAKQIVHLRGCQRCVSAKKWRDRVDPAAAAG